MTPRDLLRLGAALGALGFVAACSAYARVPDSGRGEGQRGAAGAPAEGLTLAAAAPGAVLPFGEVATACGVEGAALGTPIEEMAGYVVHDTAPGTVTPRTHFVTGFSDGCPRQVTAALALFGDPVTHETFRYQTSGDAYGPVDDAYEAIKGEICGVPAGQPCGAATDRLAADTAFLTLYPAFGGADYVNVLFHAGEVVAADPVE